MCEWATDNEIVKVNIWSGTFFLCLWLLLIAVVLICIVAELSIIAEVLREILEKMP